MTPVTNFGRLTTGIAAYIGVCLLSLLIVSMSNFVALDPRESQVENNNSHLELSNLGIQLYPKRGEL